MFVWGSFLGPELSVSGPCAPPTLVGVGGHSLVGLLTDGVCFVYFEMFHHLGEC